MKPDDVISMSMQAKVPGDGLRAQGVDLTVDYGDALDGDPRLFARQDSVEEAWRIVEGVLDSRTPLHDYRRGSSGPDCASLLPGGLNWPEH